MCTYLARVDSQTIILVLDYGIADGDIGACANIKGISVVASVVIAVRVVNGNMIQHEVISQNTKSLHGGIFDVETSDSRVIQAVCIEELGLGLATVRAPGIPPAGSIAVDDMARFARDVDVLSRQADQRALPFFISEGCLALENDLASG